MSLIERLEQAEGSSGAVISDCGRYRYRLERNTAGGGATCVLMVNPSTADATKNDATIRKLLGFGNRHRWGRLLVGNLFAFRATDVRELGRVPDPVGPDNDSHLAAMLSRADEVIVAWGPLSKQPRALRHRYQQVIDLIDQAGLDPLCIGQPAKCGHPKHPLMLSYDLPITRWLRPQSERN